MKNNNKNDNKKDNKKTGILTLLSSLIILCVLAIIIFGLQYSDIMDEKTLTYTELLNEIYAQNVEKIEMTTGSSTATVTLKEEISQEEQNTTTENNVTENTTIENETSESTNSENSIENNTQLTNNEEEINENLIKTAIIPNEETFIQLIQEQYENGNPIELEQKNQSFIARIPSYIISLLPTIIMVALFIMIFKMQGLTEKGQVYDEAERKVKIRFDDVAGLDEEKAELVEIVDFLKNPKKYTQMGAKIPRGILLYGKPGTGKTLIAKAIAGEANVPFISMSGSEFIEMFAGLGASRVRKLFDRARKLEPCIVFIDEIDAIGSRRTNASGAESENNQTLNQLLVEMDGFETNDTIIVLAATNRPEMLDKALLRPGRFDRQITIAPPDLRGREEILKIYSKEKKFAEDIDLKNIAEDTAGFTGAELANVLNEAAIIATVNKHEEIRREDLEEAVKKVTVGLEKTSRVISDKDKKLTAYHEAGHAIVSRYLKTSLDVKEISIIPRGVAGGYTMYKTNEDKFYISKTEMEERLISLLGGRVGEKVALDEISTGASNDLEVATKLARDMIIVYGMSDKIGPISLKVDDPIELEFYGHEIEDEVGKEIRRLLDTAYSRAMQILIANRDKLEAVAQALLEKETITQEEFEQFFRE